MENKYYFVGEATDGEYKILGFNLTEEEKNKLYYSKRTPSGGMTGEGNYYGALPFKVENVDELIIVLNIQKEFTNKNDSYSYVILSENNKWLASGFNESLEGIYSTIKDMDAIYPDTKFYVFETTGKHLEFE